ncbi:hypothetical protein NBE98_09750 [Clostridium swellfunianum]|uniref:hypothetical protein n=1 Tax=Clostridium swellfunianum TaxID=1367462 RepID=UPI00202DC3C3|nr:hypothetical protein [Clostridium swellfunianum]MCM0648657.1 hypothetical protein [Clostridium swellfunianum]
MKHLNLIIFILAIIILLFHYGIITINFAVLYSNGWFILDKLITIFLSFTVTSWLHKAKATSN